jgi:hypothetical protein
MKTIVPAIALLALTGAAHAQLPGGRIGGMVVTKWALVDWSDGYTTGTGPRRHFVRSPSAGEEFLTEQACDERLPSKAAENPGRAFSCTKIVYVERPPQDTRPYRNQMEPADGSSPYVKRFDRPVRPDEIR